MANQSNELNVLDEKPPSPVLSNKSTRKYLLSRKLQRKSRVQLSKRFPEDEAKASCSSNSPQSQTENSFELIINSDSKTEQIEAEEARNQIETEFTFKKPESHKVYAEKFKSQSTCNDIGFKTAGGKNLILSDEKLKLSKKLFDDILSPNDSNLEISRSNKYRFLSKRKSADYIEQDSQPDKKVVTSDNINEVTSFGFKTASGKTVTVTDSAYQSARKKFNDLDSIPTPQTKDLENEFDFFSTQETEQLFSDFTELENNDSVLESPQKFKGFCLDSIEESKLKAQEFLIFYEEFSNEKTLCASYSRLPLSELHNETLKPVTNETHSLTRNLQDFQTTSGSFIKLSKKSSQRHIFQNADNDSLDINQPSVSGFKTASGNSLMLSEKALKKAKNIFQNIDTNFEDFDFNKESNQVITGSSFQTAAGNKFKFSEESLKKGKTVFENLDMELMDKLENKNKLSDLSKINQATSFTSGFHTASGNALKLSENSLQKAKNIFQNIDNLSLVNSKDLKSDDLYSDCNTRNVLKDLSFKTAAGHKLDIPEDSLKKAKNYFQDFDDELSGNDETKTNFQSKSENPFNLSDSTQRKINQNTENISVEDNSLNLSSSNRSMNSTQIRSKKRLGVSFCKQIPISKQKLENAMKIFEDDKTTVYSPIRTKPPVIYNSTPLKDSNFIKIETDITPIKTTRIEDFKENLLEQRFVIKDCTKGNVDIWDKLLEDERKILERKLRLIEEKRRVLQFQKHLLDNNITQKRIDGVLFEAKKQPGRVSLKKFIEIDSVGVNYINITPQNAKLVHFKIPENVAFVKTQDGASIVPNLNHQIGLSEIEVAFKVIPGIDPKLIPDLWISNHFKWIVWKLASYENFSKNFKNCLTLENVIQQLKYRYDREIDRAERPTLRKIFEMDDSPQKRMVLCVSDIYKSIKNCELELTDGWYSIRTTIDECLNQQILQEKIKIGTKLIICCAEILNCEGCHPLQATDSIRLKINCNSTRRIKWWAKLGYQNSPEAIPVALNSVYPNGGLIGCVKFFVARVYPVKYLEKQNNLSVWRNRKAEELRAQEWENKGREDMEKLRETISRDYELSLRKTKPNQNLIFSNKEIAKISCPETLFYLYQNNNDPESFQELLSNSQKKSIRDYQERLVFKQQQELSRKLQENVNKMKIPQRVVSSVFQFLVVEALTNSEKTSIFQIWQPLDSHLEMINESSVFYAYNILPKKNGDLSSMKRTKFHLVQEDVTKFNKYKRRLLRISEILDLNTKPIFNEFDTVGVVVFLSIESCNQNLWLSDSSEKLLFIKIFEGPRNCLLLDKIKIGQIVAVSNLIFCKSKMDFSEAIANHLTVISCYPQQKYLQEGINRLNEEVPKDLTCFLEQCNQKIIGYIDKVGIQKNSRNNSSTLVQTNSLADSDIFDDSSNYLYSMLEID